MRAQRVGEVGRDNCLLPETKDRQNYFWPRPGGPRDLHSAERSWVGWKGQVGSGLLSLPPPPCPLVPAVSPQHAHVGSRISEPPPPPGLCLPRLPRLSPPAVLLAAASASLCLSRRVAWGRDAQDRSRCRGRCREARSAPFPLLLSSAHSFLLGEPLIPATWPRPGGATEPLDSLCLGGTAGLRVDREAKDRLGDTETLDPASPETRGPRICQSHEPF